MATVPDAPGARHLFLVFLNTAQTLRKSLAWLAHTRTPKPSHSAASAQSAARARAPSVAPSRHSMVADDASVDRTCAVTHAS